MMIKNGEMSINIVILELPRSQEYLSNVSEKNELAASSFTVRILLQH